MSNTNQLPSSPGGVLSTVMNSIVSSSTSHSSNRNDALNSMISNFSNQQKLINLRNSKYNQMNLMLNMSNYLKTQQLEHRVEEGEKEVINQGKLIDSMESEINRIDETLQKEQSKMVDLLMQFEETKKFIDTQKVEMQLLADSKFKNDFIVDAGIVVLSSMLLNSPFFDWPIKALIYSSFYFKKDSKKQLIISRLLRCILFVFIARTFRIMALRKGFHNYVGNANSYTKFILNQAKPLDDTKKHDDEPQ